MKHFSSLMLGTLGVAFVATHPAQALAQTPEGLMKQDAASSGSTNVANEGFEKTAEQTEEGQDATELKFSAGGLLATGNSRSMAGTGSGHFRLRRDENQFQADVAGNYARAAADADSDMETSAENVQGRVRYDRFLTQHWSVFGAVSARRDRFQGLDLRLNVDPGVAYYFFELEKHRAWAELGYDLQYDIREDNAIAEAAAAGTPVDKTEVRHSVRAFAGYENNLNEAVRFNTGLEYIQAVVDTENWRLNWDVGLTSSIAESFSLATTFSLRYDNNPLPGIENIDTTTAVNLVYQML